MQLSKEQIATEKVQSMASTEFIVGNRNKKKEEEVYDHLQNVKNDYKCNCVQDNQGIGWRVANVLRLRREWLLKFIHSNKIKRNKCLILPVNYFS